MTTTPTLIASCVLPQSTALEAISEYDIPGVSPSLELMARAISSSSTFACWTWEKNAQILLLCFTTHFESFLILFLKLIHFIQRKIWPWQSLKIFFHNWQWFSWLYFSIFSVVLVSIEKTYLRHSDNVWLQFKTPQFVNFTPLGMVFSSLLSVCWEMWLYTFLRV